MHCVRVLDGTKEPPCSKVCTQSIFSAWHAPKICMPASCATHGITYPWMQDQPGVLRSAGVRGKAHSGCNPGHGLGRGPGGCHGLQCTRLSSRCAVLPRQLLTLGPSPDQLLRPMCKRMIVVAGHLMSRSPGVSNLGTLLGLARGGWPRPRLCKASNASGLPLLRACLA